MIHVATKKAHESKFRRARVGAVIAKGHRLLSSGCNRIGYSRLLPGRPYPESIHAEQQAILALLSQRRLDALVGATIYVSRVGRDGSQRLSKPCYICASLIEAVGIHKVVYTTNTGVEQYNVS